MDLVDQDTYTCIHIHCMNINRDDRYTCVYIYICRTKGRAGCQTTLLQKFRNLATCSSSLKETCNIIYFEWILSGYGVLRKHKNPPDQVDDSGPPQASHARLARHLGSNKTNNLNSFNVESSMFTESKDVSYGNQSIRNKFKNKIKLAGGRIENHKNG